MYVAYSLLFSDVSYAYLNDKYLDIYSSAFYMFVFWVQQLGPVIKTSAWLNENNLG